MKLDFPDGTRVIQDDLKIYERTPCYLCRLIVRNPLIVLCKRGYCLDCYPKAIALLEAEIKVEMINRCANFPGPVLRDAARRRMEYLYENPPHE